MIKQTNSKTCVHRFTAHAYVADVYIVAKRRCSLCGLKEKEIIPRNYQSYCVTEKQPNRYKYLARLAQEGLKEPKHADDRD